MCDAFYERYKDELSQYDAFIVTHTPSFAMLYEKFNKPVIIVASTRYEAPFTKDPVQWNQFNDYLRKNIDTGLILPLANNKYDAAYAEYFTQRQWHVIPSLCEYPQSLYTGHKEHFLYSSLFKGIPLDFKIPFISGVRDKSWALKRGYSWADLADFRGIIHVPYNTSQMSIFEQYTANIPLFFPTLQFLKELYSTNYRKGVLSQLSYNQILKLPSGSVIAGANEKDPNSYGDISALAHWIALADYYDQENMPHISYFDSFDELRTLLKISDLKEISRQMASFNLKRKERIFSEWAQVLCYI